MNATIRVGSIPAYVARAVEGEAEKVRTAPNGHRNADTFAAMCSLGELAPHLTYGEALAALTDAALANPDPLPASEVSLALRPEAWEVNAGGRQLVEDPSMAYEEVSAETLGGVTPTTGRRVRLTAAGSIRPRRVKWLWDDRLALGTLSLVAGGEGLGKSTVTAWLAAEITHGRLPGEHYGKPRGVIVAATEDSWSYTLVPRLIAAGADLSRVFRVEVESAAGPVPVSLPQDLAGLADAAREVDAALLVLDPLMSRLDGRLDTHRDAETRRGLEPLAAWADQTGAAVLGLIHHNKSGSADPLRVVMGSRAFTAVARSVHTVVSDPDDETDRRRLFATSKNNLGRSGLPTLAFTVEPASVPTDDGPTETGRLQWAGESRLSVSDALAGGSTETKTATAEAAQWLDEYLASQGGTAASADAKRAGARAGHSPDSLKRACRRLGVVIRSQGYPRVTFWDLPEAVERATPAAGSQSGQQSGQRLGQQSGQPSRGESLTALTNSTRGRTPLSASVGAVGAVGATVTVGAAPTETEANSRQGGALDVEQVEAPDDAPTAGSGSLDAGRPFADMTAAAEARRNIVAQEVRR